jgi:hypothetical protein
VKIPPGNRSSRKQSEQSGGAGSPRELARLIRLSDESVETFIAHCEVAARDLLMPHGDVVMTLSIVLRIRRTMNGSEIDELISDLQTRKALAAERRRRADWHKRELSARSFRAE